MRPFLALGLVLAWLGLPAPATAEVLAKAPAAQTRAPAAPTSAVRVEVFASGLEHPWSLQFLPDGRLLVTERPGRLRIVARDGQISPPLAGVPRIAPVGQGGLLDVAFAPDFATSARIVLSYAESRGSSSSGTSVATARLVPEGEGGHLADVKVIFQQMPAVSGGLHFGSRLAFARDGVLFVTLGERNQRDSAQDLTTHLGKIVRIGIDGTVPPDNPFPNQATRRNEIWSYGHRNVQSAAIHPATGKLWTIEHGPRGGDEVNIPAKGRNYGWPVIGYGIDYSGAKIHESAAKDGMEQPVYYWRPSIAPSGMAFYTGALFPGWKGNLFVGALAGQALHRLVLDGERVVAEEILLRERGDRIRDVRQGPDGALWLLTDALNGRILRVVPSER